jgi:hypothetical protein
LDKKRPEIPKSTLNKFVEQLISQCWTHDPKLRPQMKEIELMMRLEALGGDAAAMFKKWDIQQSSSARSLSFGAMSITRALSAPTPSSPKAMPKAKKVSLCSN